MALAISAGSEGLSEATPLVRSKKHLHRFSDASLPASAGISFNVKCNKFTKMVSIDARGRTPQAKGSRVRRNSRFSSPVEAGGEPWLPAADAGFGPRHYGGWPREFQPMKCREDERMAGCAHCGQRGGCFRLPDVKLQKETGISVGSH
jgi:hypothetical protein